MDSKKNTTNSQKAKGRSGPKTVAGKSRSSLNAMKYGVFSAELLVIDADRPMYDKIRNDLYRQLKPNTAAQQIAFQNVIACAWRCVLALRLEGKRVMALLTDQTESRSEDSKPVNLNMVQWFASSRSQLRNVMRWLLQLETKLQGGGPLTGEDKETMSRAFGPGFVELLEKWPDQMSSQEILFARSVTEHAKSFGLEMPKFPKDKDMDLPQSGDISKDKDAKNADKDEAEPRVLVDPRREQAMVLKLIEERRLFLEDLLKFSEQAWVTANSPASNEFNPRYFASATKDLQRAFRWFLELRKRGL
jgi:hypothetical protein